MNNKEKLSDLKINQLFKLLHPEINNNNDIKLYQILNYHEMLKQLDIFPPKTNDEQQYLMNIHDNYLHYVFLLE